MNAPAHFTDALAAPVFDAPARARFAAHYPEKPHVLAHNLTSHPLLEIEALAQLAEKLPIRSVEYNRGDLPIGVDGKPGSNGMPIAETIRRVAEAQSWAVLKNIEQVPAYEDLLLGLLEEIRPEIEAATGAMLTPQGFIFVSSPDSVTPSSRPAPPASCRMQRTRPTIRAARANCTGMRASLPMAPNSRSAPARRCSCR